MADILVIGGSYFAGRVFLEAITRSGAYNIHAFNRGNIPINLKGVTEIVGNREIPEQIRRAVPDRQWDVVIDFCADTPEHIHGMLDNIPGRIGHYILLSTTSVYALDLEPPVSEDAPKLEGPQPELGPFADYGYGKWLAECALQEICERRGIAWTVLRPGIIYGRYNYAPRESFFFNSMLQNREVIIPADAPAFFSFIWVDDLARVIMDCLTNPDARRQTFNVVGKEPVDYALLVKVFQNLISDPLDILRVTYNEIVEQQIPIPFPPDAHLLYDGTRLRRQLNFDPTPFPEGMAATWQHYLKVMEKRKAMHIST